jgi:hypothetical protein
VERRGARFIEAPFTGSKVAAQSGQLVYYIGGDEAALKQARPVLEASSKEIIVIGKIGDASVIKVATNLVTAATAQIAAEALVLVREAGISPELFGRAMKSNASNSATLEMKLPLMLAGDFEPHFSVKHMLKDVRIASRLAREYSLELPVAEVASDMLLAQLKEGRGDADYSSVAQRYFPAAGGVVRPEPVKTPETPEPAEPACDVVAETKSRTPPPREPTQPPPIKSEPIIEAKPIVPTPELKESRPIPARPIPAEQVPEAKPVAAPPELKESPAKAAEPIVEAKPAKPKWIDEDEEEADEIPQGVNLSGGIRGWLSRHFSAPGRKS